MSERILINPVTRIEGHAKISIYVDDNGQIEGAQFHVVEFRGFEKFAVGRPFHEMPGLMSRVCGICPVSHILASSKAGDMLLGVEIPAAAERQRRLILAALRQHPSQGRREAGRPCRKPHNQQAILRRSLPAAQTRQHFQKSEEDQSPDGQVHQQRMEMTQEQN